jgi:hypothetical protein
MLGFFLAPHLLEKILIETMQKDFNAELRIDKIEVNPFALNLRVNGLALDNPDGEPTIRIQEIFSNFQLSSIFRLALTFDEIRFIGPEVFVVRDQAGEMDFAYLTESANAEASAQTPPESSNEDEGSSLLPVLIYQFAIENFVVHWADHVPLESVKTQFGPIAVDIKDLNTLPNQSGQQTVVIATQNIGTLSWTGDLQLNPLRSSAHASLESAQFALVSAYIRHQTGVDIVDGSADIELDYEVHQTDDGQIKARVENFNLTLSDITIKSFADGTGFDFAGDDQQILKLPKMVLADGQFHWPELTVSLGSVLIDNPQIDTLRDENGVFNLEPGFRQNGSVGTSVSQTIAAGEDASSDTATEDQWQLSIGNLAVNDLVLNLIDKSVSPSAQLGITDFNLKLSDLSNRAGAQFPMTLSLQALSGGRVSLNGAVMVIPQPAFNFEVSVDALQLAGAHPYVKQMANLNMDSGAINLHGEIEGSADEPFAYNGNFEIADLVIAESVKNERLASWKSFRTDKIAFSLGKRQLDVSLLQFDQLYGDILIDWDGNLNLGQVAKNKPAESTEMTGDADTEVETESKAQNTESLAAAVDIGTETKSPDFKIQIGGIVLSEASADFADLSLPLPFAVKIDSLNGKMTTISNQSIEPSEVSFEGKVDEYGFARISGIITPLDPKKNTNILLTFENIDVPKFTPYTIPFAGREIASGSLDLKLGYQVKDSQLVGENSIILRDFELGDEVPHPDALDIPLGLAIALLKDASGKIDIDLPVSGNVDSPEFSYADVVWGALSNLLVKIVLSPFSFLGSLLGIEASELETFKFLDGRSDLTPPEMQRAGKLAEALALRPELQLVIKGVSDAKADSLALQSAHLDEILELRITELTAASDPSIQYTEHRRTALEHMMTELLGESAASVKLTALETQFTTQEIVEGQTEPISRFDNLAYSTALNQQLVAMQELDQNALGQLADSRAIALQAALLSIDQGLRSRVVVSESIAVTRKQGEPIEMPVTLDTGS